MIRPMQCLTKLGHESVDTPLEKAELGGHQHYACQGGESE
jgi:hypothetical protein